jgi:hypothetical protein
MPKDKTEKAVPVLQLESWKQAKTLFHSVSDKADNVDDGYYHK